MEQYAKYFPVSCLKKLISTDTNESIVVGVVQMLDEGFTHYGNQRLVILADESGARIGATVPNHLLEQFAFLKKDQWYSISNYRVEVRPHLLKWTEHNLHIVFHEKTICDPEAKKKDEPFEFLVQIYQLVDGSAFEKFNIVNVLGGVVKVEKLEDEELVFWIKDFDHRPNTIKCVARGKLARKFETLWLSHPKRVPRKEAQIVRDQPEKFAIFIFLKNWRIDEDENDEYYLRGERQYSDLEFDPCMPTMEEYTRMNAIVPVIKRCPEDAYEDDVNNFKFPEGFVMEYSVWDT